MGLTYTHSAYLLNASLESFHAESWEWFNDIDTLIDKIEFMKEEMTFFHNLIHKKCFRNNFSNTELGSLEKELDFIREGKLVVFEDQVAIHKDSLAVLLNSNLLSEGENYRKTHKALMKEIDDFQLEVRDFKKKFFSKVKNFGDKGL